jgi:hypothetical protein
MDRLRVITLILAAIFSLAGAGRPCAASGAGSLVLDWKGPMLEITGTAEITPGESGNIVGWQYEANLAAQKLATATFVRAMEIVRIDAYRTAQDVLLEERDRNERIYGYVSGYKKRQVSYTDREVTIKSVFPLFGRDGFASILVSAGLDTGSFPKHDEYVFTTSFSGLVVDARGLGRVPAISPRILDEDHRVVYSKDYVDPVSFALHGAVQYTSDPFYRGLEDRVGENPLRLVALADQKTIETDITISNAESRTLIQNDASRANLAQGRVIIIIDEGVILQRRDYRF